MWIENLENPETVKSIFKDEIPELRRTIIKEIALHQNGSTLNAIFDISEFPKNPPSKWKLNGYNTVSIELLFVEIDNLKITNWNAINRCVIEFRKREDFYDVKFAGDIMADFKCRWIRVQTISGYINSERVNQPM